MNIMASFVALSIIGSMTYLTYFVFQKNPWAAPNILDSLLPLFGAWVGTILAYYFSKENYKAATDSTERLVTQLKEQKLKKTYVKDIMSRNIYCISEDDATKIEIEKAKETMNKKGHRYLPILNIHGAVIDLLYREDLNLYASNGDTSKQTLKALIDKKDRIRRKYAFINKEASLADAKIAGENFSEIKVIFITNTGSSNEKMIGMITTTDIAKYV
ncbi:CBS domain protein [Modicisalibacter xianhensis]|uniref:CBS domain protein n=1 Tax=Modicisalibacter xianhensis TaxID=442341 RepID=A0A4R8FLA3_9GAMM|nr:CBS domain-containing protein [Halomonas xianhensis]TDX23827.1 CBS domain protein [Halomonas xianhensis]